MATSLAKPSAVQGALPSYLQISEMLAREIAAGLLLSGERLPPERQMAREYGVAVGTLRKSLSALEGMGLLDRRQGSGNYIRHSEDLDNVYAFFRIELCEGGGLPSAETLSVSKRKKPKDFPAFGTASDGFRFRRLRYLSDIPVALEEIWLDGVCAETISQSDLSESLYLFYKQRLGLWITRAEDRIGVAPVPDWDVDQFGLKSGQSVGYIERIATAQTGASIEYSRTWYDPNVARYVSRLK